jgi:predicted RNA binding protein YcfA (HicA-like mRNA interferase family)
MSPKLRTLSGKDVILIMEQQGFAVLQQRGGHVKLRRVSKAGEKQTLTIPMHGELDKGTLVAIMRQASRYIPSELLRPHFFSE